MNENYTIIIDQPSMFGQSYRVISFDTFRDYEEWKNNPKNSDWIITFESMENFPAIEVCMEK